VEFSRWQLSIQLDEQLEQGPFRKKSEFYGQVHAPIWKQLGGRMWGRLVTKLQKQLWLIKDGQS